jgi:hypothetical protein
LKLSLNDDNIELNTKDMQLKAAGAPSSDNLFFLLLAFGLQRKMNKQFQYDGVQYTNFELTTFYRGLLRARLCPPAPAARAADVGVASTAPQRPRASGIAVMAGAGSTSPPSVTASMPPAPVLPEGVKYADFKSLIPDIFIDYDSQKWYSILVSADGYRALVDNSIVKKNAINVGTTQTQNLLVGLRVAVYDKRNVPTIQSGQSIQLAANQVGVYVDRGKAHVFQRGTPGIRTDVTRKSKTEFTVWKTMLTSSLVADKDHNVTLFDVDLEPAAMIGLLALVRGVSRFRVNATKLKSLAHYGRRLEPIVPAPSATGGLPRAVAYFGAHADSDTSSAAPSESESDEEAAAAAQPFARLHPARRTR